MKQIKINLDSKSAVAVVTNINSDK